LGTHAHWTNCQRLASALDLAHAGDMWLRRTYRTRRTAAGLVLLAGGLGCGGKTEAQQPWPDPAPTVTREVPGSAPPSASAGESPRPAAGGTTGEAPSPQNTPTLGDGNDLIDPTTDHLVPIDNVLMAYCGPCHSSTAPLEGSGGIRFMDDLDQVVAAGLIVPLDSAASRVVVVSANGSMPPPSSGLPSMSDVDLEVLISFIDNPLFWPPYPPVAVDAGPAPLVDAGVDGG
jgi:hypothetical protein